MDGLLIAIIGVIVLALVFDFTNGFHDAANSVATVVATRALPARWAPWFSAVFNFSAFFVVGTAVANTVAKVVKHDAEGVAVVFAALIAAITWNYLTWYVGMPSSSSHAIIGGLVGAGLAAGGLAAINWGVVQTAVLAIVVSPAVAFTIAFLAMLVLARLERRLRIHENAKGFKALQLVSAAAVSFGHGANDAQKTMGIMAAALLAGGYLTLRPDGSLQIDWWIPLLAYSAIALGTVWGGWKIIETMGLRITTLRASSGFAANVGAVTAIFGATGLGIPISTTHAAASSITGSGVASGQGVNVRVVLKMVASWVITIPSTVVIGWAMFQLTQLPGAAAWVAVGSVLFVLIGWIAWAMAHAVHASDIAAEIPTEAELGEPVLAVPHIQGLSALDLHPIDGLGQPAEHDLARVPEIRHPE
ncbi:MAG TPA: inorganic phosphate transporter [Propionibacteriaceae bacterium]|nr:inorganic phosphate transporter [Propionibacteriaceae bacterium]